jgi:hypothetical protein
MVPNERKQEMIGLARQLTSEGLSSRQVSARLEQGGHHPKVGERWRLCRWAAPCGGAYSRVGEPLSRERPG